MIEAKDPAPGSRSACLVNYKAADYRGFVFVLHEAHGLMLLHCTRKKKKPPHYQIPGGHVDQDEFLNAAATTQNDRTSQLLLASKNGAARELYEETGIDVRASLDRLVPAAVRSKVKYSADIQLLPNEYKHRVFYFLVVTDDDFFEEGIAPIGCEKELWSKFKNLKLKLSDEHSGFTFESDPNVAIFLLSHHSGGKVSEALSMAMLDVKKDKLNRSHTVLEMAEKANVTEETKEKDTSE